jgi:hypothetical protein
MRGFNLIVPTKMVQSLGYLGSVEKEHRGRLFRVDLNASGIVCLKDGAPIAWEKLPHQVRKAAHEAAEILKGQPQA